MPNPTTYAADRQFVGLAREVTQGTAVAPTATLPIDKFEPEDKPVWLDDKAMRGSMVDLYNRIQGPIHSEIAFGGPWFGDFCPHLLANILGDVVESGTSTGSGGTTLQAGSSVGATTISTVATIAPATVIQIDTGANAEVRTVTSVSGGGPFTLTLDTAARPLAIAHLASVAVQPITTPRSYAFAVLNSGAAQPGSLTFTDYQGVPAGTGARVYPGVCLSELTIKGNAESTLMTYEAKASAWPSAIAGVAPTSSPSTIPPVAAWRAVLGLAGPASGGTQVKTVGDWEVSIKRELEVIFTAQNSQSPYFIQRGKVTTSGKLNFAAVADENALLYLLNNTQPQLQLIVDNGLAGASKLALQIDALLAAWDTSKIDRAKAAVGYQTAFVPVANSTNTGQSGGFSPLKITCQNAVGAGTYIP